MKAHPAGAIMAHFLFAVSIALAQNPPSLALSPASISFPKTPVGSGSAPLTLTVINPTGAPIQLQEILVSGIDFSQTNECGAELAPNARCSIQITFRPAIPGERLGSLEVIASGSNAPQFVALAGTGE